MAEVITERVDEQQRRDRAFVRGTGSEEITAFRLDNGRRGKYHASHAVAAC